MSCGSKSVPEKNTHTHKYIGVIKQNTVFPARTKKILAPCNRTLQHHPQPSVTSSSSTIEPCSPKKNRTRATRSPTFQQHPATAPLCTVTPCANSQSDTPPAACNSTLQLHPSIVYRANSAELSSSTLQRHLQQHAMQSVTHTEYRPPTAPCATAPSFLHLMKGDLFAFLSLHCLPSSSRKGGRPSGWI